MFVTKIIGYPFVIEKTGNLSLTDHFDADETKHVCEQCILVMPTNVHRFALEGIVARKLTLICITKCSLKLTMLHLKNCQM